MVYAGHDILLDPRPTDRGDDGKNRPPFRRGKETAGMTERGGRRVGRKNRPWGRRWNDPQGWWKEEIPG